MLLAFWPARSHLDRMDFAASILLGNILTVCFIWGCVQFHRHDYRAPWLAYAAFLFPLAFLSISVAITEGMPPQFDAIAPLQSAASSQ